MHQPELFSYQGMSAMRYSRRMPRTIRKPMIVSQPSDGSTVDTKQLYMKFDDCESLLEMTEFLFVM